MDNEINKDYINDAFTKTGDSVNLEADNFNVSCITSKNNKFNLDSEGNLTVKSINVLEGNTLEMQDIFNVVYPIGSIYISVIDVNPGTMFGGSWERVAGRFLIGAGVSDRDERTEIRGFENGQRAGRYATVLSAAIGATNSDIGQLGYIGENVNSYQNNNKALFCLKAMQNTTFAHWNHSTPVTENDSSLRTVSNMPPYLVVSMWKRIA